jgi:hypothetical protein
MNKSVVVHQENYYAQLCQDAGDRMQTSLSLRGSQCTAKYLGPMAATITNFWAQNNIPHN